jgi:hypothetical protein
MINTSPKTDFGTDNPKRLELEGSTDGGNVGTDIISPQEGASDDESDEPSVLPSNPPQNGKRCGARLGGSKSNAINPILRLFLYHFLHTMSS